MKDNAKSLEIQAKVFETQPTKAREEMEKEKEWLLKEKEHIAETSRQTINKLSDTFPMQQHTYKEQAKSAMELIQN